ncbi:hypothetical protein D1816_06300 [Aquimarina sp. AD10]|uniref:hypothetical protein n=1 Tax=Aquimarina sp. AD10 TaxID=1714849 RepID=UPI000E5257E7|nr:hypothetical protein [Aquimarina sp. AD10]AXT59980.1 hypothetical protein D1816_06300 [Aquimarina sp. AD10]RKM93820.1 hypothetical protein D7033_19340 [Aquimarina sp. AD10]
MKTATVRELKKELEHSSHEELMALCLRLSRFKKENKELLTYLLFEATDEEGYIQSVKQEIDEQFKLINTTSYHYIKKSVRKILRNIKKHIRYSSSKETEVELLLFFCDTLIHYRPYISNNSVLKNIYFRELTALKKKITTLHEDLQFDYYQELEKLPS